MQLQDAQRAGSVRSDTCLDDLLALANAIAIVTESSDEVHVKRLMALVMNGIRLSCRLGSIR